MIFYFMKHRPELGFLIPQLPILMVTKETSPVSLIFSCYLILLLISQPCDAATDTLVQGQQLRDRDRLDSAEGTFSLGFFSPGESFIRYLGIWCNKADDWTVSNDLETQADRNYSWVANRDYQILETESGALMIDEFGILMITLNGSEPIRLSSIKATSTNITSLTLLDSGNLVLRELDSDGSVKQVLWESFDHPTDTLLPGMKLGINFKTGQTWSLTSWRSFGIPGPGTFRIGGDPNGTSQLVIWWEDKVYWTSGPWQEEKGHFEFLPELSSGAGSYKFSYIDNEDEKYFTFSMTDNESISRYTMDLDGVFKGSGKLIDIGGCGYGGAHDIAGCVEKKLPDCRGLASWDSPKLRTVLVSFDAIVYGWSGSRNFTWSVYDCKASCFSNCSCAAYQFDEAGCRIWSKGVKESSSKLGTQVYFLDFPNSEQANKWWMWLVIAGGLVSLMLLLGSIWCIIQKQLRAEGKAKKEQAVLLSEIGAYTSKLEIDRKPKNDGRKNNELQFFSFASMSCATNDFASTHKLGEGGYGPVYKGELQSGQEIAIKRLSDNSGQGLKEFKNELALIARLQHNNLVRLIGCCIERGEKMLVYEYMSNKSLDFFLFDPAKKHLLDWRRRFHIIEGIAHGLLYLHKYSRLKIIHRDLKASNILLDAEMNPKISDFGTAKIFGQNESEANTNKVIGTQGYMSPEYIKDGVFSIKSDVFSFGVLLIEIVSGRKNTSFCQSENLTLIEYLWKLWMEGSCLEIEDPVLADVHDRNEVLRCIHIGLLCIQESPVDRPSMSDIVSMITNATMPLPTPKQPAFVIKRSVQDTELQIVPQSIAETI